MRKKVLIFSGLFALAGTIAVAAVLGTAGIGKAASPNICLTASTSTKNASCVAQLTGSPRRDRGTGRRLGHTFTNRSGVGGSTATHVVLSATFLVGTVATPVTVKGVTLFVNGSPVSTASCSPASLANPVATVSCRRDDPRREFREAGGSFFRPDRDDRGWKRFIRRGRKRQRSAASERLEK